MDRLKFIDESGIHIAMMRRYGRAVRGCRVHDATPKNRGCNVTVLGSLSCLGLEALMTVEGATEASGAVLIYLSPYSPDCSPIELCWSKLKTCLRDIKARTRDALDAALAHAINTITASDAQGCFAHCGYSLH